MDWFGNKKKTEQRNAVERRLAEMEARANATHAIAFCLLRTMTIEQRLAVSIELQKFVATQLRNHSPQSVPDDYRQIYQDEFSRVVQTHLNYRSESPAQ